MKLMIGVLIALLALLPVALAAELHGNQQELAKTTAPLSKAAYKMAMWKRWVNPGSVTGNVVRDTGKSWFRPQSAEGLRHSFRLKFWK